MPLNQYDDALDSLDEQQPKDDYDLAIDRMTTASEQRMRRAVIGVKDTSPEDAAEARRLGVKFGAPPHVVLRSLDDYRQRETIEKPYGEMTRDTPALSAWLDEDPTHAALAKDDLEKLGTLEWLVTAPQRALAQGIEQIRVGRLRTKQLFGELTQAEQDQLNASKFHMDEGGALGAGDSWFRASITGSMRLLPNLGAASMRALRTGAIGAGAGGAIGAAGGALAGGVGAVPGAVAGSIFGAKAGAAIGAAEFGFELEAGLAYDEFLQETDENLQPLDRDAIRAAAIAAGVVNAGFEAFGLGVLAKSIPGVNKLTGAMSRSAIKQALKTPTVRAALADAMKTYGSTVSLETVTEVAQRAITILSGELAKAASGQPVKYRTPGDVAADLGREAIGALQSFAILAVPGPTMQVARDSRRADQAARNSQFFASLGEGVAQSETVKRAPEAVQQLIERSTVDGPVSHVYAPADTWTTYWQSKGVDPAEMAAAVTGSRDAYDEAVRLDADLKIPLSVYAVKLAGTEHNTFFMNELKFDPADMNNREAAEFQQQQAAIQEQIAARADAAVPPEELTARQAVRELVMQRAREGGATPLEAEAWGGLLENVVGTMAESAGFDPFDVMRSYGLRITRPELGLPEPGAPQAPAPPTPAMPVPPVQAAPTAVEGLSPAERAAAQPTAEAGVPRGTVGEGVDIGAAGVETGEGGIRAEAGAVVSGGVSEQPGPDVEGAVEGPGDGGRAERRRLPSPIELDDLTQYPQGFERAAPDADRARLTPEVTRELTRIADELHEFPFVERTWHWLGEAEQKTGRAAGGAAEIIEGAAGAPVYNDILQFSPLGKGKGDQPAKLVRGTRAQVQAAVRKVIETSAIHSNIAEGAVRVAERRAVDDYSALSRPSLPPSWGIEAPREFTDALSEAIDESLANVPEGDITFDPTEFAQTLFDAVNDLLDQPKPEDTLDTGEVQPRLPGAEAVRETEMPTPEFEAPFALTPPAGEVGKRGKQTTLFQSVFHGSPHQFEQFSLHAIGTGEGAQSYGWGLYFASNREIAEYYRTQLGGVEVALDGKPVNVAALDAKIAIGFPDLTDGAIDFLRRVALSGSIEGAFDSIGATIEAMRRDGYSEASINKVRAAHDAGQQLAGRVTTSSKGRVYKVDIPDDEDFLDYDKPASQQSPKVQAAITALGIDWKEFKPKDSRQFLRWLDTLTAQRLIAEDIGIREGIRDAYQMAIAGDEEALRAWIFKHQGYFASGMTDPTGEIIYEEIARQKADDIIRAGTYSKEPGWGTIPAHREAARLASEALAAKGVAGMRYLDGQSRRAGTGSANYVVFDDRLVTITEFYQPFYHGSPHDFDRFSTQHIGTGEGAAAYGWGLYFAQNPEVAADYFDRLSGDPQIRRMKLGRMVLGPHNDFDYTRHVHESTVENIRGSLAEDLLADPLGVLAAGTGGFQALVVARLDTRIEQYKTEWPEGVAAAQQLRDELARPGAAAIRFDKKTGGIYRIEIDDAQVEKMLDWDAPLNEQPPPIKDALRTVLKELGYLKPKDNGPRVLNSAFKAWINERGGMGDRNSGSAIYELFVKVEQEKLAADALAQQETLSEKYPLALVSTGGPPRFPDTPEGRADFKEFVRLSGEIEKARSAGEKQASLRLNSIGIPGIKYFDAGSRDAHKGTRNIVVFDDAIVTLTHKDGTPVTAQERQEYFQGDDERIGADKRGVLRFGADRQMEIALFAKADPSTFFHETGHFFLELFGDLVDRIQALDPATLTNEQKRMLADYEGLLAEFQVNSRSEITALHHERFARLWEAYLWEGKAPSLEVRSLMARFRAWLLGVYRTLQGLQRYLGVGVQLTDEVRGIMDRMIASEAAIKEAEFAGAVAPTFTTAEAAGMQPEQFELYRAAVAKASQTAREELDRKMLADVTREQDRVWKARRNAIEAEVAAGIYQQPVYRALAAMQRGTHPDGSRLEVGVGQAGGFTIQTDPIDGAPMKLSKKLIVDRFGPDRLKALPAFTYSVDGGLDPNVVAEMFGFGGGDELLTAIGTAPPMRVAIKAEVTRRFAAEYQAGLTDPTLPEKAQAALSNDDREVVIRKELRALAQLKRTVEPFVRAERQAAVAAAEGAGRERAYERRWLEAEARLRIAIAEGRKQVEIDALEDEVRNLRQKARGGGAVIRAAIPPASLFKELATQQIAKTTVRNLTPSRYWTAAMRAGQKAIEHAARQEFDDAIHAKQQQLLNLALFREAQTRRDDIEARVLKAREMSTERIRKQLGLAGDSFVDQVAGILDRYDFAKADRKTLARRSAIAEWVEYLKGEGLPVDFPDEVLNDARRIHYQDITVEELIGVTDGLDQILHLARTKNRLLKAQHTKDLNERAATLAASIREHARGKAPEGERDRRVAEESRRLRRSAIVQHRKLPSKIREMDGFKDGGPMFESFILPLNQASDRETELTIDATKRFGELVERTWPGSRKRQLYEKVAIPAIGKSLSTMERILVALNVGNPVNRDRLRRGEGWTDEQINAIVATLQAGDMRFVQAIWDLFESYRPEMAEKHKRVYGIEPEWVEAVPVTTPVGTFRGGYFPLKYDDRLSAGAIAKLDLEAADLAQRAAYNTATTRRGHLQARKRIVKEPVRRDFGVISEHLRQVIHDLAFHEALIDVGRLLGHRDVQNAIMEHYGDIVFKDMRATIRDVAFGDVPAANAWERILNHARIGTTVTFLGWNISTALLQPLGYFQTIPRLGAKWSAVGLGEFLGTPQHMLATITQIHTESSFMRNRALHMNREIDEIRNRIGVNTGKVSGWMDDVLKTATFNTLGKQAVVDSFFFLITRMQMIADVPTYLGAKAKAMATLDQSYVGDAREARAIQIANETVRNTQATGETLHLATVQRGTAALKLWTNFFSFFSSTYQIFVEQTKQTKPLHPAEVGRLAVDYVLLITAPAVIGYAIREAMRPDGEDDEDAGWGWIVVRESAAYLSGLMLGVREISGAIAGYYGYEGPAGARAFASASNLARQSTQVGKELVEEGEIDETLDPAFWRALWDNAGIWLHFPARQVQRTLGGMTALMEGRTDNPGALVSGPERE